MSSDPKVNILITAKDRATKILNRLGVASRRLKGNILNLKNAFIAFAVAASARSLIKTAQTFEDLSTQLIALQGSAEAGKQAVAWIKDFAAETPLSMEQVTRAFIRAKAFGLDPMDGTLQKLVDVNAKLAGSGEQLISITRAVGEMFANSQIRAQEMSLQLTNAGIPAWQLLQTAMNRANKTTQLTIKQIKKMAEQGELGRKEIKFLVDEMGRFGEGAALARMKDFTGLFSNFGDAISKAKDEFARADRGLFAFVKGGLKLGIEKLKEFRESGKLKDFGTDLGNSLLDAAGKVLIGTKGIVDAISPLFLTASDGINAILTVFNSLPGPVQSVGIIAALYFGVKGIIGASIILGLILKIDRAAAKLAKTVKREFDPPDVSKLEEVFDILEKRTDLTRKQIEALATKDPFGETAGNIDRFIDLLNKTSGAAEKTEIKLVNLAESSEKGFASAAKALIALREELNKPLKPTIVVGGNTSNEISGAPPTATPQVTIEDLENQKELLDLKSQFAQKGEFSAFFEKQRALERLEIERQIAQLKADAALKFAGASPVVAQGLKEDINKEFDKKERDRLVTPNKEEVFAQSQAFTEAANQTELEMQNNHLSNLMAIDQAIAESKLKLNQETIDSLMNMEAGAAQARINQIQQEEAAKKRLRDVAVSQTLGGAANMFNALFILTGSKSRSLFKVTKALNLAEAITSGIAAISKAASALPWPANIPGIAAMTGLHLSNVARIQQTTFGGGSVGAPSVPTGGGGGGGGISVPTGFPVGNQNQGQAPNITIHINAVDAKSFEGFDWSRVAEPISEAVGNHVADGGQTGEVRFLVSTRGD